MQWLLVITILPYFFLLLKVYNKLRLIKVYSCNISPVTYVSVVIACLNEQDKLPNLLQSLKCQDYPKELFEVIIVDDNSTDKTFEIADSFTGISNIIVTTNQGRGKKQAISTGINFSKGKLIVTSDADCKMGPDWIKTIASFYEENNPDMIVCPVQIESGSGFFQKFQQLEFMSLQGITAGSVMMKNGIMCNGANLAFTKDAYNNNIDNLLFEINSGDDIFFLHSLKKQLIHKILWLESSKVMITTSASETLISFLKQRARWIYKAKSYTDKDTITTAIITLFTIFLQISVLIAGFFNTSFFGIFLAIFLIKSIPDFLILFNTSGRYMKKSLMKWFIPVQLIYPLYVICVSLCSLIWGKQWKSNYPSQRET
jgi:cellulose synthase/poly-beta-1,6-N-acetylglucosamine synthase-like glycosyltransferase